MMTEEKREKLKELAEKIKRVEDRIAELQKCLRSDIISERMREHHQHTLKTNEELLKILRLQYWKEE